MTSPGSKPSCDQLGQRRLTYRVTLPSLVDDGNTTIYPVKCHEATRLDK